MADVALGSLFSGNTAVRADEVAGVVGVRAGSGSVNATARIAAAADDDGDGWLQPFIPG